MPNRGLYGRVRALVAWVCRRLYRVEVLGSELVPTDGAVLLAANHESSLDPALVALATERPIRFLARAELWQPGLRHLLDALGGIPVHRGRGDRSAVERAVRLLERGEVVAIFPQGTTLARKSRRYRRGAARLALATGAPVVPVHLVGTGAAFSVSPPRIGLPRLRVLVGAPIRVRHQPPTRALVDELTRRLEREIARLAR